MMTYPRVWQGMFVALLLFGCGVEDAPPAEASEDRLAVVTLSTEQMNAAGIETEVVQRRMLVGTVEATAEIVPAANRVAQLGSRVPGRVSRLAVTIGDDVTMNQIVAEVDSPELGQAKADYLAARAEAQVTREIADREAELFRERITSERDWQRAEAEAVRALAQKDAAENRLHAFGLSEDDLAALDNEGHFSSLMNIRTPIAGIVMRRPVSLGQMISPTDEILTVLDAEEVWTMIDVYDEHLALVQEGQRVFVSTRAYPDSVFVGHVDNIGAIVEPSTRSVRIRVVLPNPNLLLKPGMFADVHMEVTDGSRDSVLAVPAAALQRDGDEFIIFVLHEVGEFERREVQPGETVGEWVEILSGLSPGESVVTGGAFVLKSELGKSDLGEHGH